LMIKGVAVDFPRKPYPTQITMMQKVITALQGGENALLELPTGSGKTLALLCAVLAWQAYQKREFARDRLAAERGKGKGGEEAAGQDGGEVGGEQDRGTGAGPGPGTGGEEKRVSFKAPRIYYATRTHSQIRQVVAELKRSPYKPSMCILASRGHYCIHSAVKDSPDRDALCNDMREHSRSGGHGCSFNYKDADLRLQRKVATGRDAKFPDLPLYDIEDLVALGKRSSACPYFAARSQHETADIVFCPYTYLVNPQISAAMQVRANGAIVVFDEAHNIEDISREAASFHATGDGIEAIHGALANAVTSLEGLFGGGGVASAGAGGSGSQSSLQSDGRPFDPEEEAREDETLAAHRLAHRVVGHVRNWLVRTGERLGGGPGSDRAEVIWNDRAQMLRQLEAAGLGAGSAARLSKAIGKISEFAKELSGEEGAKDQGSGGKSGESTLKLSASQRENIRAVRGFPLSTLENLANTMSNVFREDGRGIEDFRLLVEKSSEQSGSGQSKGGRKGGQSAASAVVLKMSMVSLNPAVVFSPLARAAHSVVLASGTLSPMTSFESELGTRFPIQMEGAHVADVKNQVWAGVLSYGNGVGGRPLRLSTSYAALQDVSVQDALGEALLSVCRTVPHGVLAFFPSYALIERLQARWQSAAGRGLWRQLSNEKRIVVEPRGADKIDEVVKAYYQAIEDGKAAEEAKATQGAKIASSQSGPRRGPAPKTFAGSGRTAMFPRFASEASVGSKRPRNVSVNAPRGALMLAVCRGKVSEGIDFTNDNARAVVLFGIPYPHVKDPVISAKKGYNNSLSASRGLLSGEEWYSLQAFRALNQALGRCIRHKNDYGAIVMLDERFASERVAHGLSAWVRGNLVEHKSVAMAAVSLGNFFQRLQRNPPGGVESAAAEIAKPFKDLSPATAEKNQSRITELFGKVKTPSPAKAIHPGMPSFIDLGEDEGDKENSPGEVAVPEPCPPALPPHLRPTLSAVSDRPASQLEVGTRTAEKLSHAGLSVDDIASAFDSPQATQALADGSAGAGGGALEAAGWSLDDMDRFFTPPSASRENEAPVFDADPIPPCDLSGAL